MIHRPDWQALLFVPVGAERHLASAIRHRPDAVVLDLEDAVAPSAKAAARIVLRMNQAQLAAAGIDCVLRVNGTIRAMVEDLSAAVRCMASWFRSAKMRMPCGTRRI